MPSATLIKLLGISGSLRTQSYNSGALRAVASVLPDGVEFEIAHIGTLPFYNYDVEESGVPAAVCAVRSQVAEADALIFATPEYNFSIPGVLKNALEWLSRPPNPPANTKPCAVFGASISPLGTARGQFHFRQIAVSLNMLVVNVPHVDIASAKTKFDADGRLADQAALESLRHLLIELKAVTNQSRK